MLDKTKAIRKETKFREKMLDKTKAIRKETKFREKAGPRYTYVFECSGDGCSKEIRVRGDALKKHSGKCQIHSHIKKPFESIYNRLLKDHRKTKVTLSYEEYIEFTKIKTCHYCGAKIDWCPYATVEGSFLSASYFLDQKNPSNGYSRENCVVCCWSCNRIKCHLLTYEEMKVAMKAVLEYRNANQS